MKLIDEVEQLASEFERTMPNLSLSLDQLAMGREALYAMKLIDEVEQLAFAFERTMPNVSPERLRMVREALYAMKAACQCGYERERSWHLSRAIAYLKVALEGQEEIA